MPFVTLADQTSTVSSIQKDEWTSSDANAPRVTQFQQDASGKVTSITTVGKTTDGTSYQRSVSYNSGIQTADAVNTYTSDGKTVTESYTTQYDSSGGQPQTRTFDYYDASGNKNKQNTESYQNGIITNKTTKVVDEQGTVTNQTTTAYDAQGKPTTNDASNYQSLSPLTDPNGNLLDNIATNNFPAYLKSIYRIGIGACFVLGVIMFTWAGIEYIVSESMNTKADGKKRMQNALIGLAIALASYILLNTINPALVTLESLNVSTSATTK